jgi:hypothetical protein
MSEWLQALLLLPVAVAGVYYAKKARHQGRGRDALIALGLIGGCAIFLWAMRNAS